MLFIKIVRRDFHQTLRGLRNSIISTTQATAALRPFYFAVHPDRFGSLPDARAQNEKSLQVFNGYLNDLFLVSKAPNPIAVHFFVASGNGKKLRKIELQLSEKDPVSLIRSALEACGLSTEGIPSLRFEKKSYQDTFVKDGQEIATETEDFFFKAKRKKAFCQRRSNSLVDFLKKQRKFAIDAVVKFQKTYNSLQEEIDDLKKRTGLIEVIWSVSWAMTHMRRSLVAVKRLIDSPCDDLERVLAALSGQILRFGKGSYLCADGSIQFGVDGVPEDWKSVCLGAQIRRSQIPMLLTLKAHISNAFGLARIVIRNERPFLETLQLFQTLDVRISVRSEAERACLKNLARNMSFEIVPAYEELLVAKDGNVLVPCGVDFSSLTSFLEETKKKLHSFGNSTRLLEASVESLRIECLNSLKLYGLTWQEGISYSELANALERLLQLEGAARCLVEGLSLHFSLNPIIHITSEGKVSMPVSWSV